MFRKLKVVTLVLSILSLFTACNLLDTEIDGFDDTRIDLLEQDQSNPVTAIPDLENIDHFASRALEHILEGELNGKGNAVGFHYDRLPSKKGEVIAGSETRPNELGVYEAKVMVSGVSKMSNGGKSTFFPLEFDSQDVVDAINEAYEVREFINGNTYAGLTKDGMVIHMYLNNQDKIISAFPIY